MVQMVRGVEFLHRQNIIHRDIKPSNTLVSCDNPVLVKLTDFDFSKILEENYGTSLMTTNVGTPAFKAPEFYLRNEELKIQYHRNVDIYALGLTYLAMIQGNNGLVPQIETPNDDSERYAPIGRIIAERIRYKKEPLEVIPEDTKSSSSSVRSSQLLKGASKAASRDSVGTVTLEIERMKTLIREMTHHEPEKRPSAAHIRMDLEQIQLQVVFIGNKCGVLSDEQ